MPIDYDKAIQLYKMHKFQLALEELDTLLAKEPNTARAYSLKALAYMELKQVDKAIENAQKAVGLGPDDSYTHHVLSMVYLNLTTDYKKAEASVREALRLNPEDAEYFETMAVIKINKREYAEALTYSEKGLQIDPQNADCLSTRALALSKLGKSRYADDNVKEALKIDPENSSTLVKTGWVYLEKGDYKKALETFKDALKTNPDSEYARNGLIGALKAKHFIFRQYLKYVTWIDRLGNTGRWLLIIGLGVLIRFFRLIPVLQPIVIIYAIFAISTWLIDPIFNLLLRFDKFGKYALKKSEIIASDIVAITLLLGIVSGITAAVIHTNQMNFGIGALALVLAGIPVTATSTFYTTEPRKFRKSLIYTIVLGVLLLLGFSLIPFFPDVSIILIAITVFGEILFSWIIARFIH